MKMRRFGLFNDYLAVETDWFIRHAARVDRIPEPELTVKMLLALSETRGLHFRNTVILATAWILDNPQRAPRKRIGSFYVRWFERQTPPPPFKMKPKPPAVPKKLLTWVRPIHE